MQLLPLAKFCSRAKRRASTRAFVCLLAFSACARPIADDTFGEGDDGEPVPEAAVEDPGPSLPQDAGVAETRDAGGGGTVRDAAAPPRVDASTCSDVDHDTVCDAEDNCPALANPDQADSDGDGTGDACQVDTTPADSGAGPSNACNAESAPASVMAGDAELSNVRVNGMASPVVVRKGARLSVTINYAFGECALPIPGQPRFMAIGLEGQNSGNCQILVEVLCPTPVSASVTLNLDAPNRAGPAYVVAMGRQGFACSDSLNGAKRVASLCVE